MNTSQSCPAALYSLRLENEPINYRINFLIVFDGQIQMFKHIEVLVVIYIIITVIIIITNIIGFVLRLLPMDMLCKNKRIKKKNGAKWFK